MSFFMNPFKKHDVSEFENVYVPFENANRHPSVVATHNVKFGSASGNMPNNDEIDGRPSPTYSESAYTIEGLRAEVDGDIAASGHDTAYDRM